MKTLRLGKNSLVSCLKRHLGTLVPAPSTLNEERKAYYDEFIDGFDECIIRVRAGVGLRPFPEGKSVGYVTGYRCCCYHSEVLAARAKK